MGVKTGTRLNATKSTKGYDIRAKSGVYHQRMLEIEEAIKAGINPLSVTLCASGGSYRLTYLDVARYYELIGRPFTLTASYFEYRGDQRVQKLS
jgi:hypothetical protein